MKKVLVLEDEASIRGFIVINLTRAGYDVIEAESGEQALELLQANPDVRVAMLDIMLPGIDGFEVCRRIRATNTSIGIIMLSARSQEMDMVTGLMTGADDYVTKPFSPAELTARVDALFRRAGGAGPAAAAPEQSGEISQPPFLLNTRNWTLEKNGQRIKLTQVEYSVIKLFMDNAHSFILRRRSQQAEQIIPSAVFSDIDCILSRRFRPGKRHMPQQIAKQRSLSHAAANITDVKKQLHRQIRFLDVCLVKQSDLFRLFPVPHAACDRKQIKAAVSGRGMRFRSVKRRCHIGLILQFFKKAHFPLSFLPC